jgi:alkylation response protein AidB-like acyl-CoA dehydrogenase
VTARKPFSSGAPAADMLLTSAVYDDPEEGPTVLHFPVPLNSQGIESVETWRVMGMRGTGSNDIVLTDVFVADAAIAARRPKGSRSMGLERAFRDVQAARFHPLQEKAQLDFGGRVALGWDIEK